MSRRWLVVSVAVSVTTFGLSSVTFGQSVYGEISGTFTDSSGVPIAGAKVTVTSDEKGTVFRTTTNQSGNYDVPDLVPDTYTVRVAADGFKTCQDTAVPVSADSPSRIRMLAVRGDAADVEAAAGQVSILKTNRTDVSTTFTNLAIENLPMRDLNFTHFELLVPGALPTSVFLSISQNPQLGESININGQNFSGTAIQLDGTDNRDPLEGLIVTNPTLESIAEVKVATQNYSAEFGEATAGVMTIQTKSGSNAWHGSAFDYRRSSWGEATNPFVPTGVAPDKRNEFGGSMGGPIVRSKIFIFGDYQGTRQSIGLIQLLSVPTNTVRKTCVGPSAGGPPSCDLSEYPFPIYDPSNNTQPFSGNQIPNSRISQGAVNLLNLLPAPSIPGAIVNNYRASGAQDSYNDQFDLRTDYDMIEKLKLFGRYSFADFRQNGFGAYGPVAGGVGTNPNGFAGIGRTRNQNLSTGFVYGFTPRLFTDFRFGFFRYHLALDSPDLATTPAKKIALTGGLNNDLFSSGMPDLELPDALPHQLPNGNTGTDYIRFGYSTQVNSCNCPLRQNEQQFQWVNNWSRISGNHAVKWGADIRYLQNYRLASDRRRAGHLTFSATTTSNPKVTNTGLALATFLLGDVTSLERFYANPNNPASLNAGERQKRWFFYGQDTWQVTHNLTLNYGLRWEIYFPQAVSAPAAGGFLIPDFNNPFSGSVFNVPGAAGTNRQGNVRNTFSNFGPRVGLAYLFAPKTVVRAGYGRSFDVGFAGSIFGIAATQNPPVMISLSDSGSAVSPSVNPVTFRLGQTAPAFVFPSLSAPFSLTTLYKALTDPINGSPGNLANVYAVPGKLRLPTVDAWNLTVQHELSPTMYFELGYVGNKGTHVFTDGTNRRQAYYDLNEATLGHFVIPTPPNGAGCSGTYPKGNFCVSKTTTRRLFQPWPGGILYFGNNASNNYNSLQAKMEKQFRQGYGFHVHYTWAKGLDYDSQYFNVNPRVGYGPSNFDRQHTLVFTNLWALPVGRGKALLGGSSPAVDRIVGGWSINGITAWYSGLPFTPSYGGCSRDQGGAGAPCRPNQVGNVSITGNRNGYFTTAGGSTALQQAQVPFNSVDGSTNPGETRGPWQRPAPGTIGDVARNSFRGPSFFETDLAVSKDVPFTERVSLRFRTDIVNVFNKVNLNNPNACVDCPPGVGGTITTLAPGAFQREFQFSLKVRF